MRLTILILQYDARIFHLKILCCNSSKETDTSMFPSVFTDSTFKKRKKDTEDFSHGEHSSVWSTAEWATAV